LGFYNQKISIQLIVGLDNYDLSD